MAIKHTLAALTATIVASCTMAPAPAFADPPTPEQLCHREVFLAAVVLDSAQDIGKINDGTDLSLEIAEARIIDYLDLISASPRGRNIVSIARTIWQDAEAGKSKVEAVQAALARCQKAA